MTKIINLYGGPSTGKSTTGFQLMGYMKHKRMSVKMAPEFADEINWQNPDPKEPGSFLDNQIHIFAEQNRRLYSMLAKDLDYIITDSPLLLSSIYKKNAHKHFKIDRSGWEESFDDFILRTYLQYNNLNYFINRGDREYIQKGRIQTKQEASEIDISCLYYLELYKLPFTKVTSFDDIVKDLGI